MSETLPRKVVIIGPAHPLRGGLATFDHRLALAFQQQGMECQIYSYALQYPGLLFPGKTQYSSGPAPEGIVIKTRINSINPFNWWRVGRELRDLKPDLIIVRYWIPFMGPALGTILKIVRSNRHSRILAIADNVLPHEKRPGDRMFTGYFLQNCDGFLTMSAQVMEDLRTFEATKPALQVSHPLYDNFGQGVTKTEARQFLNDHYGLKLDAGQKLVLFFGFIRKYKGLDLLLQAFGDPRMKASGIELLVAGEFYDDPKPYRELIGQLGIGNSVHLLSDFVEDERVRYFLGAADLVVQPYRNATQSGVTPLAYHFEKPMVVTRVGSLPDMVPDGKVGLVADPDPASLSEAILHFYQLGEAHFIPQLRIEKMKYSWKTLVDSIIQLFHDIQK